MNQCPPVTWHTALIHVIPFESLDVNYKDAIGYYQSGPCFLSVRLSHSIIRSVSWVLASPLAETFCNTVWNLHHATVISIMFQVCAEALVDFISGPNFMALLNSEFCAYYRHSPHFRACCVSVKCLNMEYTHSHKAKIPRSTKPWNTLDVNTETLLPHAPIRPGISRRPRPLLPLSWPWCPFKNSHRL